MRLTLPLRAFFGNLRKDMASKRESFICRPRNEAETHPLAENTTVVLLGWAGAKDSHLAKYAELYGDRGFTTLQFTAAFDGKHPLYLKDGRDISGLFPHLDTVMKERPNLLFHTYSMNGVFALCALLKRPGYENVLKKSVGITMDSGPVYFDNVSGYREVLDVVLRERASAGVVDKIVLMLCKEALTAYMNISSVRANLLMKWFGESKENLDAFTFLKKHPDYPRHQLYLFSQRDQICKAYMIEQFLAAQRDLGNVVDFVDFKDSEHVAHLRTYPEEYSNAVDQFMEKILKEHENKSDFMQSKL